MGILDTLASLPPEQSQGLLAAGLGILANNTGHYGAFGPALGAGGLTGLQNYQGQMGLKRKYGLEERGLNIQDAYKKMQEQQMQYNLDLMNKGMAMFQGMGNNAAQPQAVPSGQSAPPQTQPVGTGTVLAPQDATTQTPAVGTQPQAQPFDMRDAMARYAGGIAFGKADSAGIIAAMDQMYPKGVAMREGGMNNPYTGAMMVPPMLSAVPGLAQRLNPTTNQYEYYKPQGGDLVSQQAADVAGAKTSAEGTAQDPHTMIEVPNGKGGTTMMSRGEYMARRGSNTTTSTPTAQPATSFGGIGTSQGTESKGYSEGLSKAREGYTSSALAAQEALPSLQLMKGALINGLKTGNLAEYTSGFGNWMQSFGVDPTQYGINDPTNVQEFSKGATKLVADMTRALGGREPFQAMQFVQKGNPGLGNTVDANVKLVALAEGTKQWEIARDREAQKWADAHGGTTDGFIQNFQMKNPVNRYWQQSYDALQKQMPQNPIIARPLSPTGGQNLNITTEPNSLPLKKRSDGSYDYVPR